VGSKPRGANAPVTNTPGINSPGNKLSGTNCSRMKPPRDQCHEGSISPWTNASRTKPPVMKLPRTEALFTEWNMKQWNRQKDLVLYTCVRNDIRKLGLVELHCRNDWHPRLATLRHIEEAFQSNKGTFLVNLNPYLGGPTSSKEGTLLNNPVSLALQLHDIYIIKNALREMYIHLPLWQK